MPASLHLDQMPLSYYFLFSQYSREYKVISMDRTFCRSNFNKNQNDQKKGGRGLHTGFNFAPSIQTQIHWLFLVLQTIFILMKILSKVKFHILLLSDYLPFFMG